MSDGESISAEDFTVAIIYAKQVEMTAIVTMADERYEDITLPPNDENEYILCRIGKHKVVIAGLARGQQGNVSVAPVVTWVRSTFKNVKVGLLVGIGGGVPRPQDQDVRLGDVVVGAPDQGPAVVQYDLGKQYTDGTEVTRTLNKPPVNLLKVVDKVQDEYYDAPEGEDLFTRNMELFAKFPRKRDAYKCPSAPDQLFETDHADGFLCSSSSHEGFKQVQRDEREPSTIKVHYGTILSGGMVMKSRKKRDELSAKHYDALCFEMEAAGVSDVIPCLVIRGICDYSDSHKNDKWQHYAAATAACYAREILLVLAERVEDGVGKRANTYNGSFTISGGNNYNNGIQQGVGVNSGAFTFSPVSTYNYGRGSG
ncbi:uncharacterized protein DFL_003859 [Arthrobotrys flagrans]|uniref:Nucleoside phosphorylase domain-containing protein n=1 Tax=Arthrobotrys flagrans TaxID=97331 RepID=A0A437A315_ARTFL|nr:hypothetical protein DFL_003859 [Arthrobotrys flagrans]